MRVGVLYGGRSGEHEVSLCSAAAAVSALDRNKYEVIAIGIDKQGAWHVQESPRICDDPDFGRVMELEKTGPWFMNYFEEENKLCLFHPTKNEKVILDIIFPVVHGTYCEDGTLQGLLELAMVPYVGADVVGSAVGMDKDVCKRLLRDGGVPVVPWHTVHVQDWEEQRDKIVENAVTDLGLPLFVKPCNAGSSVGVKKISAKEDFIPAMDFALRFDSKVLIEKAVAAREVECAVLGNERPEASALGEVVPKHDFYSYEAKYIDDEGADLMIPAPLTNEETEDLKKLAVESYLLLNCSGMARVDFFIDKNDGSLYLNEINTLPGFTSISMYPKLWEFSGLPYGDLLDRLIELALDRHRRKKQIDTELRNV